MANGTVLYASQITSCAVSVWFVSWALRRKYELDYKLTAMEQLTRWVIVAVAFGLTFLPDSNLATVRITSGILGIAFVAWPNLARHLMGLFGR